MHTLILDSFHCIFKKQRNVNTVSSVARYEWLFISSYQITVAETRDSSRSCLL